VLVFGLANAKLIIRCSCTGTGGSTLFKDYLDRTKKGAESAFNAFEKQKQATDPSITCTLEKK